MVEIDILGGIQTIDVSVINNDNFPFERAIDAVFEYLKNFMRSRCPFFMFENRFEQYKTEMADIFELFIHFISLLFMTNIEYHIKIMRLTFSNSMFYIIYRRAILWNVWLILMEQSCKRRRYLSYVKHEMLVIYIKRKSLEGYFSKCIL